MHTLNIYSHSVLDHLPTYCRFALYSRILSTKSFCIGSSSLLNTTAVTPMFLLRCTETAERRTEENLKSLWRIMVSLWYWTSIRRLCTFHKTPQMHQLSYRTTLHQNSGYIWSLTGICNDPSITKPLLFTKRFWDIGAAVSSRRVTAERKHQVWGDAFFLHEIGPKETVR